MADAIVVKSLDQILKDKRQQSVPPTSRASSVVGMLNFLGSQPEEETSDVEI